VTLFPLGIEPDAWRKDLEERGIIAGWGERIAIGAGDSEGFGRCEAIDRDGSATLRLLQ